MEVVHGIDGHGPKVCPVCGGQMRKAISAPAVHYKGSGWAKKDRSRTPSTKAAAKAAAGNTDDRSSGGGEDRASSDSDDRGSSDGSDSGSAAAKSGGTDSGPATTDKKPSKTPKPSPPSEAD